jgi:alginate O-acetyltransferase complex protein AlgI
MAFHDLQFLVFLLVTIIVFYVLRFFYREISSYILIAFSVIFYLIGDFNYFPLLVFSIIGNWLIGKRIYKTIKNVKKSNFYVFIGVLFNIIPLAYFKFIFLLETNIDFKYQNNSLSGGLPLGISFFAFQQITFLVDVRREKIKVVSFRNYFLYVCFFAQLLAGPIVRYSENFKQIKDYFYYKINYTDVLKGISLFVMGLSKKLLIANPIAMAIEPSFLALKAGEPLTFNDSWLMAWGSQLQLYFDFSSYSDMAVGIGLMFGIYLPVNFNSPLKAVSPSDCFSRWHMSLTHFIRLYIFSPIFNLAKLMPFTFLKLSTRYLIAWILATFLSMLFLGVWHGATSSFILSAIFISIIAIIYQLLSLFPTHKFKLKSWQNILLGRFIILATMISMGLFFRLPDVEDSLTVIYGLVNFDKLSVPISLCGGDDYFLNYFNCDGLFTYTNFSNRFVAFVIFYSTVIVFCLPNTNEIFSISGYETLKNENLFKWKPSYKWSVLIGLLLFLCFVVALSSEFVPNVYGRF